MSHKRKISALIIFTIILILLPWRLSWAVEKTPIKSLDIKNNDNILCHHWHENQRPGAIVLLPTFSPGPMLLRGNHAHQNPIPFNSYHHGHYHSFSHIIAFLERGWGTVKTRIEGTWQIIKGERQP